MVSGDVEGSQLDRLTRGESMLHRFPNNRIHVAFAQKRAGLTVVCDKHAVVGTESGYQGKEVQQVADHGSLANHDPHSKPSLLERFFKRGALMVAGGT